MIPTVGSALLATMIKIEPLAMLAMPLLVPEKTASKLHFTYLLPAMLRTDDCVLSEMSSTRTTNRSLLLRFIGDIKLFVSSTVEAVGKAPLACLS